MRERNLQRVADFPHRGHVVQYGLLVGLQVVGAEFVDDYRDVVLYSPFLCGEYKLEDVFLVANLVVVQEGSLVVFGDNAEVSAVFRPSILVVGEHQVLNALEVCPAGTLVGEYERFVGVYGVDDVVVVERLAL